MNLLSKYIYPTGLALLALLVFMSVFNAKIDFNGDNCYYYIFASSLAAGNGYVDMWGNPTALFPPGYPLLMTPLRFLTDSVVAQKVLNLLFLFAGVMLFYAALLREKMSRALAFVVCAAVIATPHILEFSTMMMSEPSCILFIILAIYAYTRLPQGEGVWRSPWLYVLLFAVVYAFYIRTQAVVLAGAVVLACLCARRFKVAAAVSGAFVLGYLPWVLRNIVLGVGQSRYMSQIDFSNVWGHIRMLVVQAVPESIVPFWDIDYAQRPTLLLVFMAVATLAVVLYGLWQLERLRVLLIAFFVGNIAIVSIMNTPSYYRYLVIVLPVVTDKTAPTACEIYLGESNRTYRMANPALEDAIYGVSEEALYLLAGHYYGLACSVDAMFLALAEVSELSDSFVGLLEDVSDVPLTWNGGGSLSANTYTMVWNDEFNGNKLDESKWMYRTNYMGERASWFAGPEDNTLEFKDGIMYMKLVKRPDGQFCSASLQTGNRIWDEPIDPELNDRGQNGFLRWAYKKREPPKFEHRYGYYECRCRLQRKPGWWSAFWLNSVDIGATLDPARSGVEIDIMEAFVPGEVIPHCFHYNGYGPDYQVFVTPRMKPGEKPKTSPHILKLGSEEFHTYGLLWESDGFTIFVDGKQHGEKVGKGKGEVVSQTKEFIYITTEAMNYKKNGTKDPRLDEALGDDFAVDYIRVFDIVGERK